jgi:hypothetical protein
MTCIDCNTDWREQWEDYLESIKPLPLWPSSKELLNETALAFLRAAEPTMSPLESFELAYEDECISVEHDGLLFYDPEPIDGVLTFDNAHTLARFLRPRQWRWFHDFVLAVFWITTMIWDFVTYLLIGNGLRPKSYLGSRMAHRRLIRHQRVHRSPFLRFLPMSWMILSNTVQTPHDWHPHHKVAVVTYIVFVTFSV